MSTVVRRLVPTHEINTKLRKAFKNFYSNLIRPRHQIFIRFAMKSDFYCIFAKVLVHEGLDILKSKRQVLDQKD